MNVGNDGHQTKNNHRFVVDNSGESTPFDWYHARLNMDITLEKRAHVADVAADDHNGIVNSAFALIKKLNVKMNAKIFWNIHKVIQNPRVPTNSFTLTQKDMLKRDLLKRITIQVLLPEKRY